MTFAAIRVSPSIRYDFNNHVEEKDLSEAAFVLCSAASVKDVGLRCLLSGTGRPGGLHALNATKVQVMLPV